MMITSDLFNVSLQIDCASNPCFSMEWPRIADRIHFDYVGQQGKARAPVSKSGVIVVLCCSSGLVVVWSNQFNSFIINS